MFSGCYKSYFTDITNLNEGKVIVEAVLPTADPDVDSQDATTPDSYTIILNGDKIEVDEDRTVDLSDRLEPDVYTIYLYSNTDEMNIENNINESGEGTITSSKIVDGNIVKSLNEDFYFGTQTITVLADEVTYSQVALWQVTRTIKFNLQITEGDPERIASVAASLGGIAGEWECVEDIPIGDAVTICPTFTKGESLSKATDNNYLTSSIKVLGIKGDDQVLILTLTYTDGSTQEITSNVSDQLVGSNNTKSIPIILSGELYTPIAGSMEEATIDNWTQVNGGSETIN